MKTNKKIIIGLTETAAKKAKKLTTSNKFTDINMSSGIKVTQSNNTPNGTLVSNYQITILQNVEAIKNSLHNIFSWEKGERIILPEFGTNLRTLVYNGITAFNIEQIISEIKNAVMRWEPRVTILDVVNISDTQNYDDNTVHLEVIYVIPELTNTTPYNFSLNYRTSE